MLVDEAIQLRLVHEIHTSERRSFRACRRRWDWIFRQNYYPRITAKPLEFGVAYHRAMEVFYDPNTWLWDREVIANYAIAEFKKTCEEQRANALKVSEQLYFDDDIEGDYDERVELGVGMLRYYTSKISPVIDKGWKPVKVEIEFIVPIKHPDTGETILCTCDQCWKKYVTKAAELELPLGDGAFSEDEMREQWSGLPVCYAGRIDALVEDDRGQYWIVDWKTARSISTNDEFLYLDDQIGSYVWALRKLGLPVMGFVYHEQRKGFPKAPQANKTIRLGRKYSVNKNQDTDYDTYLATVSVEDKEAYDEGLYDEFLGFLHDEGVVYFKRYEIHKSDYECAQMEKNIGEEALDMIDEKLRIYPSPGRFGCNFCAFRQPCLGVNGGEDYQYTLNTLFEKREHYYIRERPSTESKGGE